MVFDVLAQLFGTVAGQTAPHANVTGPLPPVPLPTDIPSLWRFIWGMSALRDWMKLIVLGGFLETIRRFASTAWGSVIESFFLTAHFEGDDSAYDWMMVWLSQQSAWKTAREIQVSTRSFGSQNYQASVMIPGSEEEDPIIDKRKLAFLPSFETTHSMLYKGYWMRVTRARRFLNEGNTQESLRISILARSHSVLNQLLLEAKKTCEAQEQHRVQIYVAGSYNDWRRSGSRPKRPMGSIILDPSIKSLLLDDAREFLASESWYAERGIPFRRGYLLWGSPGSGKTSLIHSIAGTLNLDIYIINLSKRGLDDSGLNELICELPPRSIALIEEIDAAFHHGITRDVPSSTNNSTETPPAGVTLSGLLGAIDGIGAAEGRILFATTNKYHLLDAALCRPGRLDIHIKFELATKYQAAELFRCFYPVSEDTPTESRKSDKPLIEKPVIQSLHALKPPKLSHATLNELAERFSAAIPEKEFSMAALQGFLMGHKAHPVRAAEEAPAWVIKERNAQVERERLAKAKENVEIKVPAQDVKLLKVLDAE